MASNDEQRSRGPQGGGKQSGAAPKEAIQAATDRAGEAIDEAKEALGEAAGTAQEALSGVTSEAQRIAKEAAETARGFVEENKGRAAQQLGGINSAISAAADALEANGQAPLAGYARNIAGSIETFTRDINEKSVDQLIGSVGQFARSQPAAFLGAAALLGFVSSRFALSTAKAASQASTAPAATTDWQSDESEGDPSYLSSSGEAGGTDGVAGDTYSGGVGGSSRNIYSGGN